MPCVRGSLPRLMTFSEKHAADRDKFVILTFHETSRVRTLAQLDTQLKTLESDVWKKKLPFPIMMDATQQTLRDWGVSAFPTTYLVDPDGKIVVSCHGPEAEQMLAAKLKTAAKPGPPSSQPTTGAADNPAATTTKPAPKSDAKDDRPKEARGDKNP